MFRNVSLSKSALFYGLGYLIVSSVFLTSSTIKALSPAVIGQGLRYLMVGFAFGSGGLAAMMSKKSEDVAPVWLIALSDGMRLTFVYVVPSIVFALVLAPHVHRGDASLPIFLTSTVIGSSLLGMGFGIIFQFSRWVSLRFSNVFAFSPLVSVGFGAVLAYRSLDPHPMERNSMDPSSLPLRLVDNILDAGDPGSENFKGKTIAIDGTGRLLVGGGYMPPQGWTFHGLIIALTKTGEIDLEFKPIRGSGRVLDMKFHESGDFYVLTDDYASANLIWKLSGGIIDAGFKENLAKGSFRKYEAIWDLNKSGELLISGPVSFAKDDHYFVRLKNTGEPDPSFMPYWPEGAHLGIPYSFSQLKNGQILCVTGSEIVRLNHDGSRDRSFLTSPQFRIKRVFVDSSGFIYCSIVNGGLVRLSPNGSIDPTFVLPESLKRSEVEHVFPSANGVFLVVNSFGVRSNQRIFKMVTTGEFDLFFKPNNNENCQITGEIDDLEVTPDGGLYVVGKLIYGSRKNNPQGRALIRLTAEGKLDNEFSVPWLDARVYVPKNWPSN
jgi:hypothetical protein